MIGFVGDVHGDFSGLNKLMGKYGYIDEWVQLGDLGGETTSYEDFLTNLTFISGNHENWDEIREMHKNNEFEHLIHIDNGCKARIKDVDILALGGNYSSKYYNYSRNKLQQARRRHFVRDEFEEALRIGTENNIDVLLTHEAPVPYRKKWHGTEREMGIPLITELVEAVKPKYHIFGHHHKMTIKNIGSTISIGLGYWNHEFFILSPGTLEMAYVDKNNRIHRELLITS